MLFNSIEFLFIFFPLTLVLYRLLCTFKATQWTSGALAFASLIFYSWWDIKNLPIIICSITVNFLFGEAISRHKNAGLLATGILCNLGLLFTFKYSNFAIETLNSTGLKIDPINLWLPIGISFFTFTQIAYLVDCHTTEVKHRDFKNYVLFVTWFPHLIAGPILHHKEMIPQFQNHALKIWNWENAYRGSVRISIGLFKKVIIADSIANIIGAGFETQHTLNIFEAWAITLGYTLQLYFDFSGYCDMAIGLSRIFGIQLPENFNSPYKSLNIQDFWRRWHSTLGRFLRDYVYIPLGGNRKGFALTLLFLGLTFTIGGVWHGAAWTFVLWGALHGLGIIFHRLFQHGGFSLPKPIAWLLTFLWVHLCWVFFRSPSEDKAWAIVKALFGAGRPYSSADYNLWFQPGAIGFAVLMGLLVLCVTSPSATTITEKIRPTPFTTLLVILILSISILSMGKSTEFLYFNF